MNRTHLCEIWNQTLKPLPYTIHLDWNTYAVCNARNVTTVYSLVKYCTPIFEISVLRAATALSILSNLFVRSCKKHHRHFTIAKNCLIAQNVPLSLAVGGRMV